MTTVMMMAISEHGVWCGAWREAQLEIPLGMRVRKLMKSWDQRN